MPEIETIRISDDPPHSGIELVEARLDDQKLEVLVRVTVYAPGSYIRDSQSSGVVRLMKALGNAAAGFLVRESKRAEGSATEGG